MRITFVLAAADLSGGNRVISIYANRLAKHGHVVTVVSRPRRPVTLKDKLLAWTRNQPIPKNQKTGPLTSIILRATCRSTITDRSRPTTCPMPMW